VSAPVLEVEHLVVHFPIKRGVLFDRTVGHVHAVSDVSLTLAEGETLGIVGESGCGKTTLVRAIARLVDATDGAIRFRGEDITHAGRRALTPVRRELQMVFQDPQASLNPRKRVGQIVGAPLRLQRNGDGDGRVEIGVRVRELLERVGLSAEHVNRFPHEFSGGQRQRIGIARALSVSPELLVLDEPVSALDVSIQAGVVNLLEDLQDELGLAYVFIAHDLSVVRHICDEVAVMYLGKIVEIGDADDVYERPQHPYTQALLSAVPIPDPRRERARTRIILEGDVPSPVHPPSGCRFRTRCWKAEPICAEQEPLLELHSAAHVTACHFAGDAPVALGTVPSER
jgi:oligopeptide/dipeptide ABC transporter ATP-binding protein